MPFMHMQYVAGFASIFTVALHTKNELPMLLALFEEKGVKAIERVCRNTKHVQLKYWNTLRTNVKKPC